jgi:hypothetical protein
MIEGPSSCGIALVLFMLGVARNGGGPAVQEENVPEGSRCTFESLSKASRGL